MSPHRVPFYHPTALRPHTPPHLPATTHGSNSRALTQTAWRARGVKKNPHRATLRRQRQRRRGGLYRRTVGVVCRVFVGVGGNGDDECVGIAASQTHRVHPHIKRGMTSAAEQAHAGLPPPRTAHIKHTLYPLLSLIALLPTGLPTTSSRCLFPAALHPPHHTPHHTHRSLIPGCGSATAGVAFDACGQQAGIHGAAA